MIEKASSSLIGNYQILSELNEELVLMPPNYCDSVPLKEWFQDSFFLKWALRVIQD